MGIRIKFNLKEPKKEKSLILIFCRWNKKSVKVSAKQSVETKTWDLKTQRCFTSDKFADRVNRHSRKVNKCIEELKKRMDKYFQLNDPDKSYGGMSPEYLVKSQIQRAVDSIINKEKEEEEKKKITPLHFFAEYVERDRTDIHTGRYVSESTKAHHRIVLKRFNTFFKDTKLVDDWSVFHDDTKFNQKFMDWCYKKKNYKENTVYASYGVLKPWLNAAKKEGYDVGEAYHELKGKGKDVDAIYLTEDEIKRIYELNIPKLKEEGIIDVKSTIEQTRDLFVISCWTGLRRSDIDKLNDALFCIDEKNIKLTVQKTKKSVTIPMHPIIMELYKKYNGKFPKLVDKAHTSNHLQECGRLANITELVDIIENRAGKTNTLRFKKYQKIGFHTGRRSFATNMYKRGFPSIAIMTLTGHTTEHNFLKYIKITPLENAQMIAKALGDSASFFSH